MPRRWAVYGADVRDVAAITGAGRACIAAQGVPDVVIANAGISIGIDTAVLADLEVMRATYETNNLGLAATFQPFVAPMRERRAARWSASPASPASAACPGHGAYSSSKAAVIAYCESLRGELRPFGRPRRHDRAGLHRHAADAGQSLLDAVPDERRGVRRPRLRGDRRRRPAIASFRGRWRSSRKLLRAMPNALFDRVLAGRPRKKRQSEA